MCARARVCVCVCVCMCMCATSQASVLDWEYGQERDIVVILTAVSVGLLFFLFLGLVSVFFNTAGWDSFHRQPCR